jgi:hypothetical protein
VTNGEPLKLTDPIELNLEVPKTIPHSTDSMGSLAEKPEHSGKAQDEFEYRRKQFFGDE